jgi:hypothetical protein
MRVQLSRRTFGRFAASATLLATATTTVRAVQWPDAEDQHLSYLFQLFADVDDIHVFSNHANYRMDHNSGARFDLRLNHELVVIPAVEAPIGSQEAIDAITTASRPIRTTADAYEDFTKTRDEVRAGVQHRGVAAGYYVSNETDYFAQLFSASYNRDFFQQNLNLAGGFSYGKDDIEPLEDADTSQIAAYRKSFHYSFVATQVLTRTTIARLGVELSEVDGLQHNPYRNVWVDGSNEAELHPSTRSRRDLFVKMHQYVTNRSSLKLNYKLYEDDWGIASHTVGASVSQYVDDDIVVRYRYRYYTQSSADFYRDDYTNPGGVGGFQTGDYRMGEFDAHLFGSRVEWALRSLFDESSWMSRFRLSLNYERYFNSNNFSANIFESGLSLVF